jgi:hypothetical protein
LIQVSPWSWAGATPNRISSKLRMGHLGVPQSLVHNKLFRTVSIRVSIMVIDIDWKTFEAECKRIVHEISDKFIDLGLDDHESDFAAGELQAKQERFEREFSRMPFTFEATSLQLPPATRGGNEDEILEEPEETARLAEELGDHLEGLFDIINGNLKARFRAEGAIIETN